MTGRRFYLPALLAFMCALAACTSSDGNPPRPSPGPSGSPAPQTPHLTVRLARVTGESAGEHVHPADLAEPAQAVRRTIEDLYETAFLVPSFDRAALLGQFSGQARRQAAGDLAHLTLGPARSRIDRVIPDRAKLKLEFLADANAHPLAAFAQTEFEATAVSDDAHAPVVQRGEYVLRKLGDGWRIVSYDVRGRVPKPRQMGSGDTAAAFVPGLPSPRPTFVLVIGSDARPGQVLTNTRADSIHIVGVNPRRGRVSVLGIPRDSWVPIPGAGTNRINAALAVGGPELLVRTVEEVSGIPIDAYVLTGFQGFMQLVHAVGGLQVRIPYPIDDTNARAHFRRGAQHLTGQEALAFSRARHDVPAGDFSRSFNQGRVIIAALAELRRQVARDSPSALIPWVVAGSQILRTDLGLSDLFELLLAAPAFDPSKVRNDVASGSGVTIGGRSVVVLGERARILFRDLRGDAILHG
ncbi:MAG TPA: LCP family protein [Actinomycetota bacterium]|nr:LCP family protein [Actinomycetota bacterium]